MPGDILEFGTMTGRTAVALGYACDHYFRKYKKNDVRHGLLEQRKLHLFDSFAFEWKEEESDEKFVTEAGGAGLCLLFDANAIFHRAGMPIDQERFALDLILLQNPSVEQEKVGTEYLIQAKGKTWPIDPYNIIIESDMNVIKDGEIKEVFSGAILNL